jgi:hypothetical protein
MDTVLFTFPLKLKNTDTTNWGDNDSTWIDTCCDNSIKVKVFTKSYPSGTPVPFANGKVTLVNPAHKGQIEKTTDNNGWVEFTDVCAGRYYIAIDGYDSDYGWITLYCDEHKTIEIVFEKLPEKCCDNVLIVNYKDADGNSINCGTGKLYEANGIMREANVINGKATFTNLCNDRTYHFSTTVTGCDVYYYTSTLTPNNTGIKFGCTDTVVKTVTLGEPSDVDSMCCNNGIELIITDEISDVIIEGAVVMVIHDKTQAKYPLSYTNGVYSTYRHLCPGKYTIRIEVCGVVKEDTFEVICNDTIKKVVKIKCD